MTGNFSEAERSQDIYEQIAEYPKPKLIPLPEPGDMSSLERIGLKATPIAHSFARFALRLTGFRRFQEQLPERLEELLRRCDLRGAYLFAPVISATLAMEDDPRQLTPIERAATLLVAAYKFYQDIQSGRLEPDHYRGEILEMGQYPNLFSTCLVVDGRRPRIFKSTNTWRIIVLLRGRQYALEFREPAQWAPQAIQSTLAELVQRDQREHPDAEPMPPGILTGAGHSTQLRIFSQLQRIESNQHLMKLLRHSFITLCLDLDQQPSSYAEAARIGHSGNFANRWYHASLQIVVFGNARACIICNFSTYVDGNTMMRAGAEIQRRASNVSFANGTHESEFKPSPAFRLEWHIAPAFIHQAQRDWNRVLDHQPATFEIFGVGKDYFTAHGVEGVPIFMLALQLTANRFTGRMVQLRQFLTLSRYCCMGLTDAMVTTPEVIQFINDLDNGATELSPAKQLLEAAIASHNAVCREARHCLSLDSLVGLYLVSSSGIRKQFIWFTIIVAIGILWLLRLLKPLFRREVIVSHPEIYKEVPVVGRPGIRLPYVKYFGLHYQIMADRIIVTMMPSLKWAIPNIDFITELERNLKRMQRIIEGKIA